MKILLLLLSILILGNSNLSKSKELPSYINKCKLNSSEEERSQCIIKSAKEVLQRLTYKEGIPELQLPSIEPFEINAFEMTADGINITFSNITANGLKDLEIKSLLFDLNENLIDFNFEIPLLQVKVDFHFRGRLLLFDLNCSGSAIIHMTDVDAKNKLNFNVESRNKKRYMMLEDSDRTSDVKYKNGSIVLENVIPENAFLTEQASKMLNRKFEEISKDPLIYTSIGTFLNTIVYPILTENALEDLFV